MTPLVYDRGQQMSHISTNEPKDLTLTSLLFYTYRARTGDFRKRYLCLGNVVVKFCLRLTRLKLHKIIHFELCNRVSSSIRVVEQ